MTFIIGRHCTPLHGNAGELRSNSPTEGFPIKKEKGYLWVSKMFALTNGLLKLGWMEGGWILMIQHALSSTLHFRLGGSVRWWDPTGIPLQHVVITFFRYQSSDTLPPDTPGSARRVASRDSQLPWRRADPVPDAFSAGCGVMGRALLPSRMTFMLLLHRATETAS